MRWDGVPWTPRYAVAAGQPADVTRQSHRDGRWVSSWGEGLRKRVARMRPAARRTATRRTGWRGGRTARRPTGTLVVPLGLRLRRDGEPISGAGALSGGC